MHDFDPRSFDAPRDDGHDARARSSAKTGRDISRGGRGASDSRDREHVEPREVFVSQVDLPRGPERVRVHERDHGYMLRGSESRTLTTVGAFRVVPAGDLRDGQDRPLDPRRGDLYHLRQAGLVQTIPAVGRDRAIVVLTERGRDLLEANRRPSASSGRPELAEVRDHQYVLRGSESRTLTTVGAFRVVPAGDEPRAGANVVLMPSQRTQEAS